MVPSVLAKEYGVSLLNDMDLSCLRVVDHQSPGKNVPDFISAIDDSQFLRTAIKRSRGHLEQQLMNLIIGNIDPIRSIS